MSSERKVCSIICGAPCDLDKKLVSGYVIAVDSGYDRCVKAMVKPNLLVGDFDSVNLTLPDGIERIQAPAEKDETDSFLAASEAVKRGYNELRFFCALGGRLSHSLANIQIMRDFINKGVICKLFGDFTEVFPLQNGTESIAKFKGYLSVFSLDEKSVVSISGAKYPLSQHELTADNPLGISNEITADFAEITVHSGCCAIVTEVQP